MEEKPNRLLQVVYIVGLVISAMVSLVSFLYLINYLVKNTDKLTVDKKDKLIKERNITGLITAISFAATIFFVTRKEIRGFVIGITDIKVDYDKNQREKDIELRDAERVIRRNKLLYGEDD